MREFVRAGAPCIRLLRVEGRGGKTVAQNAAVQAASGEILVFSDVTTVYAPGTIRAMVANFADPRSAASAATCTTRRSRTTPRRRAARSSGATSASCASGRARFHSIIGVAGCVYAMRRELYLPLDAGAISDFVQPGSVTERG